MFMLLDRHTERPSDSRFQSAARRQCVDFKPFDSGAAHGKNRLFRAREMLRNQMDREES